MDTRTIGNKLQKEKLGQNQKQSSQVTPLPFLHPPPIETAREGTCQDISGAPLKVLLSKVPHLQNAQSGCQAAASPLSQVFLHYCKFTLDIHACIEHVITEYTSYNLVPIRCSKVNTHLTAPPVPLLGTLEHVGDQKKRLRRHL